MFPMKKGMASRPPKFSCGRVSPEPGAAPPIQSTTSLSGALAERPFWILGVVAGLALLSLMALSFNLVLFLIDEKGVSLAGAANAQSLFFLIGLIPQLLAGLLAARVSVISLQVFAIGFMALGAASSRSAQPKFTGWHRRLRLSMGGCICHNTSVWTDALSRSCARPSRGGPCHDRDRYRGARALVRGRGIKCDRPLSRCIYWRRDRERASRAIDGDALS
jgi:hypothetical protein